MFKKPLSIILIMTLLLTSLVIAPVTAQAHPAQMTQTGADSPVQLGADNSLGEMFSTAVNREQNDGANGITDVSVNGTKATVVLNNEEACTVIVGIYDESDDHLIATAIQRSIPANAESVTLTFTDALPQYYYLRAFILDAACCPLAKQYESSRYTQAYAEFLAKTTADFPAARVMNLDADSTDNFAVLDDSVTKVTTSASANTPAKTSDSTYTFSNIDDTLRSLKQGDIFTFELNGNPEVVKIGAITVSDNTATITSTKAEMEEVFDYVKIDATSEQQSQIASTGSDFEAEYSLKKEFPLSENEEALSYGVSGSVEIGVTVWVKLHFADRIREVDLVLDYGGEADAALSLKLSHSITLGVIPVPLPVIGLVFKIKAELELEAEAKLEIELPFTGTLGFHYSNKSGFTNLSHKPKLDPEITCEGKVYAGVKLTPAMDAFTVADAGISGEVGIEAVGTPAPTVTDYKESDHLCDWCIEGKTNLVFKAEAELEFGATLIGLTHKMTFPLGDYSKKLFNFHISSKNGFGIGECKNRKKPPEPPVVELSLLDRSDVPTTGTVNISQKVFYIKPIEGADGWIWKPSDLNKDNIVSILDSKFLGGKITGSGLLTDDLIRNAEKDYNEELARLYGEDSWECLFETARRRYPDGISGFTAVDTYYYEVDRNSAPLKYIFHCGWKGTNGPEFPSTLKYVAGFDSAQLSTLSLPDSVDEIGENAFKNSQLFSLRLPNSLKRIGNNAFYSSTLTQLQFNENLEAIGDRAFYNAHVFNLVLPSSVQSVGEEAFANCTFVTVPESVKEVGAHAFRNALAVTLETECSSVFSGSDKLLSAIIGEDITSIGDSAFSDCTALKNIEIPSNITHIGKKAFFNTGLTSVTVPGTVKCIDESAFAGCQNLREIVLEYGVKEISANAFANCPNLERVVIPSSVGTLIDSAFSGTTDNVVLDYGATDSQWDNIIARYSCNYSNNNVNVTKMVELPDDSPIYQKCTVYSYPDDVDMIVETGGNPQSAAQTASSAGDGPPLWASPISPSRGVSLGKGAYALTGANSNTISGKYAGAEYLIAVENAQNGLLNGNISALKQVTADDFGCIDISGVDCPDGQYLNTYGACRHPSAHAQTLDGRVVCACDICGAAVKPIIVGEKSPYIRDEDRLLGDADCDKNITILDATAVQRKLAGFIPSRFHVRAADADSDGTVTILDATAIQRYLAGYDKDKYSIDETYCEPSTELPIVLPTEAPTEAPTQPVTEPPTEAPDPDITFDPDYADEDNPVWFAQVLSYEKDAFIAGVRNGKNIVFPGAAEYQYIRLIKMPTGATAADLDNFISTSNMIDVSGNDLIISKWWIRRYNNWIEEYGDLSDNDELRETIMVEFKK